MREAVGRAEALLESGRAHHGSDAHSLPRVQVVGVLDADARAEQLETATGTGRLDLRGLELGGLAELLGHHGGEGIDRGGTYDADVIAGGGGAGNGGGLDIPRGGDRISG